MVKYYYNLKKLLDFNIFQNVIDSSEAKLNFQQPFLSSVSHDPSEIILICLFAA